MSALFGHPFTDMHLYAACPPLSSPHPPESARYTYPLGLPPYRGVLTRRPPHVPPITITHARSPPAAGAAVTPGRTWVRRGTPPAPTAVTASGNLRFFGRASSRYRIRASLKTNAYMIRERYRVFKVEWIRKF